MMQLHEGMEDEELRSQKKSAFLAKLNKTATAAPKKAAGVEQVSNAAQDAKIAELES